MSEIISSLQDDESFENKVEALGLTSDLSDATNLQSECEAFTKEFKDNLSKLSTDDSTIGLIM